VKRLKKFEVILSFIKEQRVDITHFNNTRRNTSEDEFSDVENNFMRTT
jgi:hypothetical protein